MFNRARSMGVDDEALDLVLEFAAHERTAGPMRDTLEIEHYDVPSEAMLNCLMRET
jgi:hypothetical protein